MLVYSLQQALLPLTDVVQHLVVPTQDLTKLF